MTEINKLVRDKIPEMIRNDGETPITRILSEAEFRHELIKKLKEECNEIAGSTTSIDTLRELADLIEVIRALAKLENKSLENLIALANQKLKTHGGFDERIFLERKL